MSDRCPTCGGRFVTWAPHRIIETAQKWAREHGEPPKQRDWSPAGPFHPAPRTVRDAFGSWNAMILAAGLDPRQRGGRNPNWTREAAEQALLEWVFRHGRIPQKRDWKPAADGRPTADQVVLLYGSWNAFIVAAGYEPTRRYRTTEGYYRQAGAALRDRDELGRLA